MERKKLKYAVEKIRTLTNKSTRLVLEVLSGKEMTGEEIEIETGLSQSQTSKNLTRLRDFGYVDCKQGVDGDNRYWVFWVTDEAERVAAICDEINRG